MNKYVRVSEILARLQSYADIDPEVLEAKAKIGTNVHKAIVQDCAGEFVVLESDRAHAYFESYKMWKQTLKFSWDKFMALKDKQFNITQIPRLYCDTLMLTGECDGIFNDAHLIDWKCSANANPKIWNMQAHFYWYLLRENDYNIADRMYWINLRHTKHIKKDPETNLGYCTYHALSPVVHEFQFDEKVLSECIDEVNRYWEEYNCAKVVD